MNCAGGQTGWGISFIGLGELVPCLVDGLHADLQFQKDQEQNSGNCIFNDHPGDSELHSKTRVRGDLWKHGARAGGGGQRSLEAAGDWEFGFRAGEACEMPGCEAALSSSEPRDSTFSC